MVRLRLPGSVFACNGSFGFIRCFNLGLKISKCSLQRTYTAV